MIHLRERLTAYSAWQERDLAAERIAQAIEAAAPECDADVHPAGCAQCTRARQARADAALAREVGAS